MSIITVIIPFLNESEEVFRTVESIRNTSNANVVDILLINDASNDDYNYKHVAEIFHTQYIEHVNRIGVAASREEGIAMCDTEYFLLLDAHMRFYQNDWSDILIDVLGLNKLSLLCCQTVVLSLNNGEVIRKAEHMHFGAYIDFNDIWLKATWNTIDPDPRSNIVDIPCVLGAGYACNRPYWQHLRGLHGLRSYGYDEQLISMKVWLSGGSCKLIKNIKIGHIYRESMPYEVKSFDYVFNCLYIINLLLKPSYLKRVLYKLNTTNHMWQSIKSEIRDCRGYIALQKEHFDHTFCRDIDFVISLNNLTRRENKYGIHRKITNEMNSNKYDKCLQLIHDIVSRNICDIESESIFFDKICSSIFLFESVRLGIADDKQQERYGCFFDTIVDALSGSTKLSFKDGLFGAVWGIRYIEERGLHEIDSSDLLNDVDEMLLSDDLALNYANDGFLIYVAHRLRDNDKFNDLASDIMHKSFDTKLRPSSLYLASKSGSRCEIYNNKYRCTDNEFITYGVDVNGQVYISVDDTELQMLIDSGSLIKIFEASLHIAEYSLIYGEIFKITDGVIALMDIIIDTMSSSENWNKAIRVMDSSKFNVCSLSIIGLLILLLKKNHLLSQGFDCFYT